MLLADELSWTLEGDNSPEERLGPVVAAESSRDGCTESLPGVPGLEVDGSSVASTGLIVENDAEGLDVERGVCDGAGEDKGGDDVNGIEVIGGGAGNDATLRAVIFPKISAKYNTFPFDETLANTV